jgi:hypothetical protein
MSVKAGGFDVQFGISCYFCGTGPPGPHPEDVNIFKFLKEKDVVELSVRSTSVRVNINQLAIALERRVATRLRPLHRLVFHCPIQGQIGDFLLLSRSLGSHSVDLSLCPRVDTLRSERVLDDYGYHMYVSDLLDICKSVTIHSRGLRKLHIGLRISTAPGAGECREMPVTSPTIPWRSGKLEQLTITLLCPRPEDSEPEGLSRPLLRMARAVACVAGPRFNSCVSTSDLPYHHNVTLIPNLDNAVLFLHR